jgi:hypothetical protein
MKTIKHLALSLSAMAGGMLLGGGCWLGGLDWYATSGVARTIALWLNEDLFG